MEVKFEVGGTIISKKQHACGGKQWKIVRIGADYKLKCTTCGRVIFLLPDELKKICVRYEAPKND